jgi:hypothetical protein
LNLAPLTAGPDEWSWKVNIGSLNQKDLPLGSSSWCIPTHPRQRADYLVKFTRRSHLGWDVQRPHDLEALTCLSGWSFLANTHSCLSPGLYRAIISYHMLLAHYDEADYEAWIQRRSKPVPFEHIFIEYFFGLLRQSRKESKLAVEVFGPPEQQFAQDLYMIFLEQALKPLAGQLGGKITLRQGAALSKHGHPRLQHSVVEKLADAFEGAALGSREDAYNAIFPVLMRLRKLPHLPEAYEAARRQAEEDGDVDAVEIIRAWQERLAPLAKASQQSQAPLAQRVSSADDGGAQDAEEASIPTADAESTSTPTADVDQALTPNPAQQSSSE